MKAFRSFQPMFLLLAIAASGCKEEPAPAAETVQAVATSPQLSQSTADLCQAVLSGQSLATQTLLDLAHEINPHNRDPYNGAKSDCYMAVLHELTDRK